MCFQNRSSPQPPSTHVLHLSHKNCVAQITDSHLKMAKVPEGCSELIPYSDANGAPSPFPLLAVGNVYVLPGVPSLVRAKWPVVRRQLQQRYGGYCASFLQ